MRKLRHRKLGSWHKYTELASNGKRLWVKKCWQDMETLFSPPEVLLYFSSTNEIIFQPLLQSHFLLYLVFQSFYFYETVFLVVWITWWLISLCFCHPHLRMLTQGTFCNSTISLHWGNTVMVSISFFQSPYSLWKNCLPVELPVSYQGLCTLTYFNSSRKLKGCVCGGEMT